MPLYRLSSERKKELFREHYGRDLLLGSLLAFLVALIVYVIDDKSRLLYMFMFLQGCLLLALGSWKWVRNSKIPYHKCDYSFISDELVLNGEKGKSCVCDIQHLRSLKKDGKWLVFPDRLIPIDNVISAEKTELSAAAYEWLQRWSGFDDFQRAVYDDKQKRERMIEEQHFFTPVTVISMKKLFLYAISPTIGVLVSFFVLFLYYDYRHEHALEFYNSLWMIPSAILMSVLIGVILAVGTRRK